MERRGTRWNGKDQMERKGPDGTEGHTMEWKETIWNGEELDGTERNQMERSGTRWNGR